MTAEEAISALMDGVTSTPETPVIRCPARNAAASLSKFDASSPSSEA